MYDQQVHVQNTVVFPFLKYFCHAMHYCLVWTYRALRAQVHVKSWYVFTEAKKLSGENKKKEY